MLFSTIRLEENFQTTFYPDLETNETANLLEGKIKVHGVLFKTQCQCKNNDNPMVSNGKCSPGSVQVMKGKKS